MSSDDAPKPPDWDRLSKNHLHLRTWEVIAPKWRAFFPFNLEDISGEPTLEDGLMSVAEDRIPFNGNKLVVNLPERITLAFFDAAFAVAKAVHARRAADESIRAGMISWGCVDAYHSSLLSIKAVLALFGLSICNLKGRSFLVDIFPEFGTQQQSKDFRKQNRGVADPVAIIGNGKRIEQRHIWTIFNRLLNLPGFPEAADQCVADLQQFKYGAFHSARHNIIYESRSWPIVGDISVACSALNFPDYRDEPQFIQRIGDDFRDRDYALCARINDLVRVLIEDATAETNLANHLGPYAAEFARSDTFRLLS